MGFSQIAICLLVNCGKIKKDDPGKVEHKIKVMVIDTGIEASHPDLKYKIHSDGSINYVDIHGHGTHVTGVVLYGNKMYRGVGGEVQGRDPLCDQIEIISCSYYKRGVISETDAGTFGVDCINDAISKGVEYINYSGGGSEPNTREQKALTKFINGGGSIFLAAGNNSADLKVKPFYPASFALETGLKNSYVIINIDSSGRRYKSSNWFLGGLGEVGVNILSTFKGGVYKELTGTSLSTPAVLHTVLKHRCELLNRK